uniref:CSON001987 protein n=1 Tax=Culicoides sonorensis TaxID=179676 RepID=A0A336MJB0_CULSO
MNERIFMEKEVNPMISRLIEEVRKRPQLWNPNHYLHHTRPLVSDNWEDIANALGSPTCSFLWNVLDTSQLDCTPEQIEELKLRYGAHEFVDETENIYEQFEYRENENNLTNDDNSMDFHDYMFAGEVPAETLLQQEQMTEFPAAGRWRFPEEGEIITDPVPDDESDVEIIEPEIEHVEVPDDEEEPIPKISPPKLVISEPRTLKKPPLKKYVPMRIVKKIPVLTKITTVKSPIINKQTEISQPSVSLRKDPLKNDTDMHYLKSLLPYFRQINSKRKQKLKEEIKKMLEESINGSNVQDVPLDESEPQIIPEINLKLEADPEPETILS